MSEASADEIFKAGLDLLVRREHSALELKQKLLLRQCNSTMAQQIVDLLQAEGHLSNQRFAEEYVHSRIQKADGPLKILSSLYARGIDDSDAAIAMQEADVDWYKLAERTFTKKLAVLDKNDSQLKDRLERFMRSRGYEYKFFKHLMNKL